MEKQNTKRVKIAQDGGRTVYFADAWPGWDDIIGPLLNFVFVFVAIGIIFYYLSFVKFIAHSIDLAVNSEWLGRLTSSVIGCLMLGVASIPLGFSLVIALILAIHRLLELPYILVFNLSPKKFWLENKILHHKTLLAGFIPVNRKIPFDRILDIEIDHPGDLYKIKALYEMKLPKIVFVVLVFWSDKLTYRHFTLVNGIRCVFETTDLRDNLMDKMTDNQQ